MPQLPADPPLPARRNGNHVPLGVAMIPLGLSSAAGVYLVSRRLGRNEVFAGGAADAAFGDLPPPTLGGATAAAATTLVADEKMEELATIEFVPPKGIEPWQGAVLLEERIDDDTVGRLVLRARRTRGDHAPQGRRRRPRPRLGPEASPRLAPSDAAHVDQILDGDEHVDARLLRRGLRRRRGRRSAASEDEIDRRLRLVEAHAAAVRAHRAALSAGVLIIVVLFVFFGLGSILTALLGVLTTVPLAIAVRARRPGARRLRRVPHAAPGAQRRPAARSPCAPSRSAASSPRARAATSSGRGRTGCCASTPRGPSPSARPTPGERALRAQQRAAQAMGISSPLLLYSMAPSFAGTHIAPSSSGGGRRLRWRVLRRQRRRRGRRRQLRLVVSRSRSASGREASGLRSRRDPALAPILGGTMSATTATSPRTKGTVYFDEPPVARFAVRLDQDRVAVADPAPLPRLGVVRLRLGQDVRRQHHVEVLELGR